jgi:hypothetical protein
MKKAANKKKKTLGVCGDSFFAATQNFPRPDCQDAAGKHFSELLAQHINYNLFTLARSACSNSAIRLQVSEMVKRKVDFIIVGTTSSNRIEYPMYDSNSKFDFSKGIYNLYYTGSPDASALHFDSTDEVMYTDTLNNIFGSKNNSGLVRNEIQRAAIQHYFMQMFDFAYREQQDAWIIASGIQEIRASGIPYLLLSQSQPPTDYFQNAGTLAHEVFGTKQRDMLPHNAPCALGNTTTRRWHTSDEFQSEYAHTLYDYITKHQLLG